MVIVIKNLHYLPSEIYSGFYLHHSWCFASYLLRFPYWFLAYFTLLLCIRRSSSAFFVTCFFFVIFTSSQRYNLGYIVPSIFSLVYLFPFVVHLLSFPFLVLLCNPLLVYLLLVIVLLFHFTILVLSPLYLYLSIVICHIWCSYHYWYYIIS